MTEVRSRRGDSYRGARRNSARRNSARRAAEQIRKDGKGKIRWPDLFKSHFRTQFQSARSRKK